MPRIYNQLLLKKRRKILRNNPTEAEKILWLHIHNKMIHEVPFYRQYGIGSYIADFYAPSIRLCIEVDGSQHFTSTGKEYDEVRDNFMKSLNIEIVRFRNQEVLYNIDKVIEKISTIVLKLKT